MERGFGRDRIRYVLGDVRDRDTLLRSLANVHVVVHTAALKHVPKCEYSPFEAVKTNILGAQNIIDAAIECGVEKVLAVSTDKAVNPINLYGATKLCADKLFLAASAYTGGEGTRFSVIRFGNFIGSRGSVIPLFKNLKKNGSDYLPVTHPDMTRFFIPLNTAVNRVFEALSVMRGGEVFNPKMASMKIGEVARAIHPNAKLKNIGIRKGEKQNEDMIISEDAADTKEWRKFYVTNFHRGKRVSPEFFYRSDTNDKWMTPAQLREIG
jgi:UDP-N-acetylglucosamine 4,6-dehydratase